MVSPGRGNKLLYLINIMKYNIALCFYGEARHWQVGLESISKFHNLSKDQFNTDVYCHLWDNITRRTTNILDLIRNKHPLGTVVTSSNLQHEKLLKKYNPVNYKIENKNVLDSYVDKFKPNDKFMSTEEYKLAIKYSNNPCFSQLYSSYQSYDIIPNKCDYDLIIITRTDCLFDDKSITDKTLRFFCKYVQRKSALLVERLSLVPPRREVWMYSGYMLGSSIVFDSLFENFPKNSIGMGQYRPEVYGYKGNSHAEFADYVLNYTNINRVWPILVRGHPWFVGKYKQFTLEQIKI